ncbi:alpha/beta fold hydrolase [Streptomyces hygroscopicus]|uniref:alpha/beta hydrolase n=1 Tax=Streptomyces hygroscopicus TaxID=1912 RepID=UPI0033FF76FD
MIPVVHHRTTAVDGLEVFYREAGDSRAPAVVLLHGFPASSRMFRHLIPALADRYHVIAPDHVGFGQSAMPSPCDFPYGFDALTRITSGLLRRLGVDRFAMYVHGYGAPIGWRLALRDPERVTAITAQNGNAYVEGFVKPFWGGLFAYAQAPGPKTEGPVRAVLTAEMIRWQYLNGVPGPSLVSPDNWVHGLVLLARPGNNDEIQLTLFRDYPTNVELCPRVQRYFRDSRVPLLAVWGASIKEFIAGLLADRCEVCGNKGDVEVRHVRALVDLAHAGWQPSGWARVMFHR